MTSSDTLPHSPFSSLYVENDAVNPSVPDMRIVNNDIKQVCFNGFMESGVKK